MIRIPSKRLSQLFITPDQYAAILSGDVIHVRGTVTSMWPVVIYLAECKTKLCVVPGNSIEYVELPL